MTPKALLLLCLCTLTLLSGLAHLAVARQSTIPSGKLDPALIEQTRRALTAQLRAVRTIDVHWYVTANNAVWEHRATIDGERYRQRTLIKLSERNRAQAAEQSFDGQYTYARSELGTLYQTRGRERPPSDMQHPGEAALNWVEPFLLTPKSYSAWTPEVAERTTHDGIPVHRLVFVETETGTRVESMHDPARGSWPIYLRKTNTHGIDGNQVLTLQKVESDGNTLYYPIDRTAQSTARGEAREAIRCRVKEGSLTINRDIPPSEFRMDPLPFEEVQAFGGAGLIHPPRDPTARPSLDDLQFPWKQLWDEATDGGRSEPLAGTPGIKPTPGQAIPLPSPRTQSNSLSTWAIALAVLAAALAAVVALLLWRQRTAST